MDRPTLQWDSGAPLAEGCAEEAPPPVRQTLFAARLPQPAAAETGLAEAASDGLAAMDRRAELPGRTGAPIMPSSLPESPPPPALAPEDLTGAGQIIVVIDDGYSPLYDQSRTVDEFDYYGVFNDPVAEVDKLESHGSWVAQTALDVAPEADIVHFKVFPDQGGSAFFRDIEEALDAAVALAETAPVAAVNLSLGFGNATEPETSALSDELAALAALGVPAVAAAGNSGADFPEGVSELAADPNAIAVSATTEAGSFASFSQRDPELTDIAALGTDIEIELVDGRSGLVDGTSFSAPYVSGAFALLQEAADLTLGAPLSPEAMLELLQLTGEPVAGAPEAEGYRIADADAALALFLEDPEAWGDALIL